MTRFRVLQFNMQFGQGWDDSNPDGGPIALERTLAEIQRHDADIIFLQEVEKALPGGRQIVPPPNYSQLRAALPQYHGCFTYPKEDPRELPFGIGLAILSRYALSDVTRADLASPPLPFEFMGKRTTPTDRVLLGARTRVVDHEVTLLNTHLLAFFMLGSSSETHPEQRRAVAEHLAAARGPTLLAGDFNVRRHQSLVSEFATHGFATAQDREITWRRQPFVLDHVFYNPPLRCVSHEVVPTMASDHHALVADFELV